MSGISMRGDPVKLEFSSADATTAAAMTMYDNGGAARTIKPTERLVIVHVSASLAAAVLSAIIFDDVDGGGTVGSGERLAVLGIGPNSLEYSFGDGGPACGQGRVPKIKAAVAGQIDVVAIGYLMTS